jgi:hypothetical protein
MPFPLDQRGVPYSFQEFLETKTYPVKIGSVPMSFDSLVGYFSSVHETSGGGEDCPGHEHNQDPGHHSKQGAKDVGIDEATHRGSLGIHHNRLYAGGFLLFRSGNQAR